MTQRSHPREIDPAGVPDGSYALTVAGGKVTGLTAAGTGGGGSADTWDGLVAALSGKVYRWRCNETSGTTITDEIAGKVITTSSGTLTWGIPTPVAGNGVRWNAWTGSTAIGSFPTGSNARCIITLIRTPSLNTADRTAFSYGSSVNNQAFYCICNSGSNVALNLFAWSNDLTFSGADATDGTWHVVAWGGSGNRLWTYCDSELQSRKNSANLATASTNVTFGGGGDFEVGDIVVLNQWPGKAKLDRLYALLRAAS